MLDPKPDPIYSEHFIRCNRCTFELCTYYFPASNNLGAGHYYHCNNMLEVE